MLTLSYIALKNCNIYIANERFHTSAIAFAARPNLAYLDTITQQ